MLYNRFLQKAKTCVYPTGTWYHLAVQAEESRVTTYVNGVLIRPEVIKTVPTKISQWSSSVVFNGGDTYRTVVCMDELLLGTGVRGAMDVKQLYRSYTPGRILLFSYLEKNP